MHCLVPVSAATSSLRASVRLGRGPRQSLKQGSFLLLYRSLTTLNPDFLSMELFMLHHEKEKIHVLDPDFQALAATEGIIAACTQLPALKPSTAQYPHFRIDRDASTSSAQRLVC